MKKSLLVVAGSPRSGKSQIQRIMIDAFREMGHDVIEATPGIVGREAKEVIVDELARPNREARRAAAARSRKR